MLDQGYGPQALCLVFAVRDRLCAFDHRGSAGLLPWLQRYTHPSGAPGVPEWCLGLLNVRGAVQMIVDLGHVLGFGLTEPAGQARLIFLEHGAAQLGLLVDREIGMRQVALQESAGDDLLPFQYASGQLDGRPVALLDGAALIAHLAAQVHAPAYLAS